MQISLESYLHPIEVLARHPATASNLAFNAKYGVLTEDKPLLTQFLDGAVNAGGTGDKVSNYVDFAPWASSSAFSSAAAPKVISGNLVIGGTSGADTITVSESGLNYVVTINGASSSFAKSTVTDPLVIYAFAGGDTVTAEADRLIRTAHAALDAASDARLVRRSPGPTLKRNPLSRREPMAVRRTLGGRSARQPSRRERPTS